MNGQIQIDIKTQPARIASFFVFGSMLSGDTSSGFSKAYAHLFFTYMHNRIGASAVRSFDSMLDVGIA